MPINNFGQKHPNIDDQQKIDDGLALIEAVLLQLSTNLSDEERQRFGSINEQNKLHQIQKRHQHPRLYRKSQRNRSVFCKTN